MPVISVAVRLHVNQVPSRRRGARIWPALFVAGEKRDTANSGRDIGHGMSDRRVASLGFDFGSLRRAYREGTATPVTVAEEVLARIAAAGDDGVWISRVADDVLLAEAQALAPPGASEALPLYGLPFA